MNVRFVFTAAFALSILCWIGSAQAGILFSDNYESYTNATNYWYSDTDNDPAGYTVMESNQTMVQLQQSPMGGSYVFDTPYGSQFLHVWRDAGGPCEVWKGLTSTQQAEIAANGSMRIEFYAHNVYERDGWAGNIGIIAFDSAPQTWTGRAADLALNPGGTLSMYEDGHSTSFEDAYTPNTWQKYTIDMDFTTDRWSVAVDGVTVASDLVFEAGDLDKVQYVMLTAWDYDTGEGRVSGRGGFDNLTISSPVPEPSSVALLAMGLIALLFYARRIRK